jgi:hypothetical protein
MISLELKPRYSAFRSTMRRRTDGGKVRRLAASETKRLSIPSASKRTTLRCSVRSKALLKVARVVHQARNASGFGLSATTVGPVNLREVMDYVRRSISEVHRFETPEVLRQEGVDVRIGRAKFEDANTLAVASAEGETTITAKKIIICTGARPTIPNLQSLSDYQGGAQKERHRSRRYCSGRAGGRSHSRVGLGDLEPVEDERPSKHHPRLPDLLHRQPAAGFGLLGRVVPQE